MRMHVLPSAELGAMLSCLACRYGPNALTPPKKPGFFMKLWAQVNNIMVRALAATDNLIRLQLLPSWLTAH